MTITLQTAAGLFDVLDGSLCLALEGVPVATLELSADAAPELGPASLLIAEGDAAPVAFAGVLDFAHPYQGRVSVTWVGGGGALGGATLATHYTAISSQVARADVLSAILSAAGETLAPSSQLPADTLPRWTRVAGETWSKALRRALDGTGLAWRVLDSGEVWIGAESWPLADLGGVELDEDVTARSQVVACERATLRPGTALEDGRHVVRVTYQADGLALVDLDVDTTGAAALAALLAPHSTPDLYARVWPGSVVLQRADGTVDVRLDEGAPVVDLPRLRYDAGARGARYVLPAGSRVRVAFEGAHPSGAFAFGAPTAPGARKGVARLGDHGITGTLSLVGAGALTVTYTPPGGAGQTIGTITATAGATPVVFAGLVTIPLETLLDRVSEEVFLT